MHSLDLSVRFQPIRPQLPPNPTLLEPTKRRLNVQQRVRVDPYCSGFQCAGNAHGLFGIVGEYGGGEAVGGVVCEVDCFFLGFKLGDDDDGSKDL
jgi:hypothetical protein